MPAESVDLPKAQAKTDCEQKTAKNIAKRIETAAGVRFQVFRARNFAVAAIEDAVDLEKRRTDNEPAIVAALQEEECRDWQSKDRQCPRAWREGRF